jgi:hypothetical protein
VESADECISGLVFLSYLNNVFFICMQLLSGLE